MHEFQNQPPGFSPPDDQQSPLGSAARAASDAIMVRKAIRERWGAPPELKRAIVKKTGELVPIVENANELAALGRMVIAMDQVDQVDDMNDEKNARLDAGKATERVEATVFNVPPPREINRGEA